MYAVIRTGGKQYKVEAGEQLEVERLGVDEGGEVELAPILVVDGETVLATPAQLDGAVVKARVVGATRGPTIGTAGFTAALSIVQLERIGITPASGKK